MNISILAYEEYMENLKQSLKDTDVIKGTTAFWTLYDKFDYSYLSNRLISVFSKPESYICCDVSTHATDIEAIDSMAKYGCKFFVYTYRLSRTLEESPPSLLHSKILLLKQNNGQAIVFIGSHNMTNRALRGYNTEHSLMIECSVDDPFVQQIESVLENIKQDCIPYDHSMKDIFIWLQDGVDIEDQLFVPMLFVCVPESSFSRIKSDNVFVFVSFNSLELDDKNVPDLKERDRLINLFVFTPTGRIQIFSSELIHTGTTDVNNDSTKINSEGADYFGLWIRSLSYYMETPIFTYPINNLSGSIFNIDNTHYYRLKILREVNEIYKVKTGKDGFRSKVLAWIPVEEKEINIEYADKVRFLNTSPVSRSLTTFSCEYDYEIRKKNPSEAKFLQINKDIFSDNFLSKMFEKNKSAFAMLHPEEMIDIRSEEFHEKHSAFEKIRAIIFESLNSDKKLSHITEAILHAFPKYRNAMEDPKFFRNKHVKFFRNMRDKFFNR
jgi:hypothetical protein